MATIVHSNWLVLMLSSSTGTHAAVDVAADNMDASLLDATDANGGTALTAENVVDYADVNDATVVATTDVPSGTVATTTPYVWDIAAAITFSSVSGDAADYLTLWKNITSAGVSPLLITWDSASTGLPVTPNGGDITATWTGNDVVTLA